MGFTWRSPSPKHTVWLVQSSQAMAGRAGQREPSHTAAVSSWCRRGRVSSIPSHSGCSGHLSLLRSPVCSLPAWPLTQGCRTSLPSAARSPQALCEARSPLHPPQTAPATSHSPTLSWSTLGHLQLLPQHRDVTPLGQWLTLFVLARGEPSLWACSTVTVPGVLKNMFHVALNFI